MDGRKQKVEGSKSQLLTAKLLAESFCCSSQLLDTDATKVSPGEGASLGPGLENGE